MTIKQRKSTSLNMWTSVNIGLHNTQAWVRNSKHPTPGHTVKYYKGHVRAGLGPCCKVLLYFSKIRYLVWFIFHFTNNIKTWLGFCTTDDYWQFTHRVRPHAWWRHQMETFSPILVLCAGNSPDTGEFPALRPVTRSFDVFFSICATINGWVNKREAGDWRRHRAPLWRQYNRFCPYFSFYCGLVLVGYFTVPSGLTHRHWDNNEIAPVSSKQSRQISVKESQRSIYNQYHKRNKQIIRKSCEYFMVQTDRF